MGSRLTALAACLAFAGFAAVTAAPPAIADSGSGSATFSQYFEAEDAATFSKDIEKLLAAKQVRVAIVFRTGRTRDKLPDGIEYTHGGFWVYQPIQRIDGSIMRGYVGWNLFHGDGAVLPKTQSYLAKDFPFEFVGASAVSDLAVIVPTPEIQRRIRAMMADGRYEAVHDQDYSLIASPFDGKYQNCNEFILDVVSAAVWETTDYDQLKLNLSAHFQASKVKAGLFARMFGPMADERLKLADHRGKAIRTVTYASLSNFMMQNGYADETFRVTPNSASEFLTALN